MGKKSKITIVKEYSKEIRGITLIALVVTIIVLLILAGISIGMLTGDNGIIKQAGEAKNITEQKQLEQDVDLAYLSYADQTRIKNDLEYYLNKIDGANVEKVVSGTWHVSRGNSSVTVSDDGEKEEGKTEIWDGTSIKSPEFKEFNWYIYTPSQLKFFADFVNNGNSLTGTVDLTSIVTNAGYRPSDVKIDTTTIVYLMKNIDMGARPGNGSTEEQKWEIESNESRNWTPIGKTKALKFVGTFEGNNKTIKGVYVDSTKSDVGHGLFGNSSTIQNTTIKDSYIKGGTCTGGIVGAVRSGKIENCHNKNTIVVIEGDNRIVGGVAGQVATGTEGIFNCTNNGKVLGYGRSTGKDVEDHTEAGGVVGRAIKVEECKNFGSVYGEGIMIGGIIGCAVSNSIITECSNSGTITGSDRDVAGIAGFTGTNTTISKCSNSGTITADGDYIGGIEGFTSGIIEKCFNSGTVKQTGGTGGIGGIAGETPMNDTVQIQNCYNIGKVIEEGNNTNGVGGIVGYISTTGASGQISHNYSIGEIEIKGNNVTNVGGVIGRYAATTFEINNNYYELNKSNATLNELGEGKKAEVMKTQTFVDLLNLNQKEIVWELGTTNYGYPTLKKEE